MTAVPTIGARGGTEVRALGVVIPARDEQDRIGACLTSVRRALAAIDPPVRSAVTVVLDRCRDATPRVVAEHLAGWAGAGCVRVDEAPGGVGALRHRGAVDVLARLGVDPARTWLLSTDADSAVPADWAQAHLAAARAGVVGVAGLVELDRPDELGAVATARYRELLGATTAHVYGANLGVRADAYLAAGGFPVDGPGEDHGLWTRLRSAGHRLYQPGAVPVRTSARRHGRASGGLADLLAALSEEPRADLVAPRLGRPDPAGAGSRPGIE